MSQKFESKADTLVFLQKKLKKGIIEEIITFTVEKWEIEQKSILEKIIDKFYPNKIIIRSSAIGEDSIESTEAGKYKSIQKISTKNKGKIKNSINEVIKEYENKGNKNIKNKILIQRQTTQVITNGVIFTNTPENGSPYYVINFSDSENTDNVTKGETSNLLKIFRGCETKVIPKKWKKLISVIKEIEQIFSTEFLDIEFGITKKNIVIFQVRPLTTIKIKNINIEKKILKLIKKNQIKYKKIKLEIKNKEIYFSDMADWNPAEIIGNNPNPLDYSLYNFLIMKKAWQVGRIKIGYSKNKEQNLMEKFGNKPYVNIIKSFNSLFLNNFNNKLQKKLLKFYLKKLKTNPHLHDKVEFEILFSCFDFTFEDRGKELMKNRFTKNEINDIKIELIKFTNKILKDFVNIKKKCIIESEIMEKNRIEIKKKITNNSFDNNLILNLTKSLLNDCKKYGTTNFSTMARIAFIGNILLKSLEKKKIVNNQFINQLMSSISSPLSEIQNDLKLYQENRINEKILVNKYGHLRPGTYDIMAERYDENLEFLQNINFSTKLKKQKSSNYFIEKSLQKEGIELTDKEFITFIKDSIRLREVLKFEFTKNLSDSLYFISKIGEKLGFTKNDLAYLEINDIIYSKMNSDVEIKNKWRMKIEKNKKIKKINEFLVLPPIIYDQRDFEIINYNLSEPNFITTQKISKEIQKISNLNNKNKDISEKIIVIENADPGYDWIFTKNPSALITKYGGVASHMAIRCAEIGLPAAIGCGELMYEQLKNSSQILLDCKHEEILILEHYEKNDEVEARKILKSLGYIK